MFDKLSLLKVNNR